MLVSLYLLLMRAWLSFLTTVASNRLLDVILMMRARTTLSLHSLLMDSSRMLN